MIALLRDWFRNPDIRSSEKALYAAAALTFFSLPLGTAPSTIAAGLSLAIWLFSGVAVARRQIYLASYWWPVYALMLLPWIGLLYSRDTTGLGLDYAEKTYYWLFGISVAAIAFEKFSPTPLVQAFMLGLGLNVLAAILQIVFHLPDKNNWHLGLGPDYSTLSAYLIVGIMLCLFFMGAQSRIKTKMALAGLVGLYFFHLVMLQSRASYVAFLILVPFMSFTFFRRRQLLKTITLCILIPGLMLLSPVVRDRVALTTREFAYHLRTEDGAAWGKKYSTQQDRFYMWQGALGLFVDNPLIGVGTGGFATALQESGNDPKAPLLSHPHNNFLYMAASFGLVGLAVFIWFLYVTITRSWRQRHTTQGYMLLSVILVMLTSGLFNSQIIDVGTAFLISLSVGLQASYDRKPS